MYRYQTVCSCVLILGLVAGCSDPETKANNLLSEAERLATQAEQVLNSSDQLQLLEQANTLISEVKASYPETTAGQALRAGQLGSDVSLAVFESRLHRLRRGRELNEQADHCFSNDDPLCVYPILNAFIETLDGVSARRGVGIEQAEAQHRQHIMIQSGQFEEVAILARSNDARIDDRFIEQYVAHLAQHGTPEQNIEVIQQFIADLLQGRGNPRDLEERAFRSLLVVQPEAIDHRAVLQRLLPSSRGTFQSLGPDLWRASYRSGGVDAALGFLQAFLDDNFRERDHPQLRMQALVELLAIAYELEDEDGADRILARMSETLDQVAQVSSSLVDAPRKLILANASIAAAISSGSILDRFATVSPSFEEILGHWIANVNPPNYLTILFPRRSQLLFVSEAGNEFLQGHLHKDPEGTLTMMSAVTTIEASVFGSVARPSGNHWLNLYLQNKTVAARDILEQGATLPICRMAELLGDAAREIAEKAHPPFEFRNLAPVRLLALCFAEMGQLEDFRRISQSLEDRDHARGLIMLEQFEDAEALIVSSRSLGASHSLLMDLAEQLATVRGVAEAVTTLQRNNREPNAIRGFLADHSARNGDVNGVFTELSVVEFDSDWDRSQKSEKLVALAAEHGHLLPAFQLAQQLYFDGPDIRGRAVEAIAQTNAALAIGEKG